MINTEKNTLHHTIKPKIKVSFSMLIQKDTKYKIVNLEYIWENKRGGTCIEVDIFGIKGWVRVGEILKRRKRVGEDARE